MLICTDPTIEITDGVIKPSLSFYRKKGLQKLLLLGAVLFVCFFFASSVNAKEVSLFNIEIPQQTNFEQNQKLAVDTSLITTQEKAIVISPTIAVIQLKDIKSETPPQEQSEQKEQEQKERKENIKYTIKEGDTISGIAAAFGLKTQTLFWANDLHDRSIIKPGDSIIIPPKDGVIYKVRAGDTLSAIAQNYKADINEIREWNQLDVDKIIEGQELFLPNATKPVIKITSSSNSVNDSNINSTSSKQTSNNLLRSSKVYSSNKGSHKFPYGYCTWYVAQKRYVPWGGNAKDWPSNAQAYGYNVCWGSNCSCPAGSILVTRESWYGHVAYVTNETNSTITISEMNKVGFGIVSTRTLAKGSWLIRACIY